MMKCPLGTTGNLILAIKPNMNLSPPTLFSFHILLEVIVPRLSQNNSLNSSFIKEFIALQGREKTCQRID
jgi:hypothetical protein